VAAGGRSGCGDCHPVDDLTKLGGRLNLRDGLDRAAAEASAGLSRPALLVVDIDGFKSVNEAFGNQAGDEVLRVSASRLLSALSPGSAAFRSGGDEFMVVLHDITAGAAESEAERLLRMISEPVDTGGASVGVSGSIAVVMFGERHPDAVLHAADLTMYRAKTSGGARVEMYSAELDDWARLRKHDVDSLAREVDELRLENQRLTQAVMIDAGTGLPNEVAFDADHLQLHARRSRSSDRYALLLVDIDHFHDYNERFRHSGGHLALRAVAQTIKGNVRQGDRAYRYGGDQFAVLLPGADLREAVVAAERIRARIEELAIEHPGTPAGVLTVTVGVLEAGFRHPGTKDVVAEVNSVLLDGKHKGRNRIVWPH
jgi:diguanylate cyclase (GGDEF)-like protein